MLYLTHYCQTRFKYDCTLLVLPVVKYFIFRGWSARLRLLALSLQRSRFLLLSSSRHDRLSQTLRSFHVPLDSCGFFSKTFKQMSHFFMLRIGVPDNVVGVSIVRLDYRLSHFRVYSDFHGDGAAVATSLSAPSIELKIMLGIRVFLANAI